MGASRTDIFTAEQNELARYARALAHPGRVAILQHLIKVNGCIGGEIVDEISLSQPTISRHLKELKDTGLIKGTIDGNRVNYCIDPGGWERMRNRFEGLFALPIADHDCC